MKLHFFSLLIALTVTSHVANAAFVDVTLLPKVSSGTLNLNGANGAVTVQFSGASIVDQIWFSNDQQNDLDNQNPDKIQEAIEQQFGVSGLAQAGIGSISGSSASIATIEPFTFLAIHFGKHELFFKFLSGITDFDITVNGKAAGLSNFRAFDKPSEVPVPAAVWLFGSAFAGLIGIKKRKAG